MSNPFQLTFTLKQHTPIIHFQHDQDGATLRATEVKPKLDRFIMEKEVGYHANYGETKKKFADKYPDWIVGKGKAGHVALDYKIHITDNDNRSIEQRSYGQIKLITNEIDDKKALTSNNISIKIFCFNPQLKKQINEYLELFFLIESFGTRQNKGWGSFTHEDTKDWNRAKQKLLSSGYAVYVFGSSIDSNDRETNKDNFYPQIMNRWRILKSGKNYNGYNKSKLFLYMCEKSLRWDKRWMKLRLNEGMMTGTPPLLPYKLKSKTKPFPATGFNEPNDCCTPIQPCNDNSCNNQRWTDDPALTYEYRFARAMLGLPEHIEFQAHAPRLSRYIYQVIVESTSGIERFKSPITFKLFENKLYAIAHEPVGMFSQPFQFSIQKKQSVNRGERPENDGNKIQIVDGTGKNLTLSTPDSSEFKITDFLDRFMKCPEINFVRLTPQNLNQL